MERRRQFIGGIKVSVVSAAHLYSAASVFVLLFAGCCASNNKLEMPVAAGTCSR